ncbi:DUF1998 domain-containing protein [candidate division KSB1 bacterium]|nr:DUF1998 domain-containing protein [candidate division KSB1 bacterium]
MRVSMYPNYPVRQDQLISIWGVGQMINFPNGESLMISGLDAWEKMYEQITNMDEIKIRDTRLATRLKVDHFRKPPDFRDKSSGINIENKGLKIPTVRFPKWHYCPKCGYLKKLTLYNNGLIYCPECKKNQRSLPMIPIHFVAVCKLGHIEDFPFERWVHEGNYCKNEGKLKIRTGPYISVICSCGNKKSMSNIYQNAALNSIKTCSGQRPWLGEDDDTKEHCGAPLEVRPISASNVYFPMVEKSLFLPRYEKKHSQKILQFIDSKWDAIDILLEKAGIEGVFDLAKRNNINFEEFKNALEERLDDNKKSKTKQKANLTENQYRKQEYLAILQNKGDSNQNFYVVENNIDDYEIESFFSNIICVPKLKETRAFCGFTRLNVYNGETIEDMKNMLMLSNKINWLPAIENFGEGIFFEFNNKRLKKWINYDSVQNRARRMINQYNKDRSKRYQSKRELNAIFILLHTFAHCFIRQLSYVCGYNSASLQERLYFSTELQMQGVLIYTTSSDADGSLGGVVNQGKPGNLEPLLYSTLETVEYCSADPICIKSEGQGANGSNLAACHNCVLLSETSCEENNNLLDRCMVIGETDDQLVGYFKI